MKKVGMLFSGGIDSIILRAYALTCLEPGTFSNQFWDKIVYFICKAPNERNLGEVSSAVRYLHYNRELDENIKILTVDSLSRSQSSEVKGRNLEMIRAVEKSGVEISHLYMALHLPGSHDDWVSFDDTTEEFLQEVNNSQEFKFKLVAPFVNERLGRLIEFAKNWGIDLNLSKVCNQSIEGNCGICPKCIDVFLELSDKKYPYELFPRFDNTVNEMSDERYNRTISRHVFPREIRVMVNDLCNRECSFCSYGKLSLTGETEMSQETIENLCQLVKDLRVERMMFSGREPLLSCETMKEIIKKTTIGQVKSLINTNGDLLSNCPTSDFQKIIVSNMTVNQLNNILSTSPVYQDKSKYQIYLVFRHDNWESVCDKIEALIQGGFSSFYVRLEYLFDGNPIGKANAFKIYQKIYEKLLSSVMSSSAMRQRFCDSHILLQTPLDYSFSSHNEKDFMFDWMIQVYNKFGHVNLFTHPIYWEIPFFHYRCESYLFNWTILVDGTILGCPKHTYRNRKVSVGCQNVNIGNPEKILKVIRESVHNRISSVQCLPRGDE